MCVSECILGVCVYTRLLSHLLLFLLCLLLLPRQLPALSRLWPGSTPSICPGYTVRSNSGKCETLVVNSKKVRSTGSDDSVAECLFSCRMFTTGITFLISPVWYEEWGGGCPTFSTKAWVPSLSSMTWLMTTAWLVKVTEWSYWGVCARSVCHVHLYMYVLLWCRVWEPQKHHRL